MIPNLGKPAIQWNIDSKLFIKENAISPASCDELIEFGQAHVQKGINKYPDSFSISFHACLLPLNHAVHTELQKTWEEARDFFNIDLSFVEPYEVKRYTEEDHFGKHVDNYYSLTVPVDRKVTMSIQLSNDNEFNDGEFNIVGKKFKLKKGTAICFPSFFPHEVSKVTLGTRWSLIGWAWGPYWK